MWETIAVIGLVVGGCIFTLHSFSATLLGKNEKTPCGCGKCTCRKPTRIIH